MRTRTDKQRPLRAPRCRDIGRRRLPARSSDSRLVRLQRNRLRARRGRRVCVRRLGFSFRLCKLRVCSRGRPCSSRGNVNQDGCHRSAKLPCVSRDDRAAPPTPEGGWECGIEGGRGGPSARGLGALRTATDQHRRWYKVQGLERGGPRPGRRDGRRREQARCRAAEARGIGSLGQWRERERAASVGSRTRAALAHHRRRRNAEPNTFLPVELC